MMEDEKDRRIHEWKDWRIEEKRKEEYILIKQQDRRTEE